MAWVTKGQIERARQVDVLGYVLAYEPGHVKRVGSGYRLKEHPSLSIDRNGFYWHSREIGGRTALDYLTDVRGYGFVEAVCHLIGEQPSERPGKRGSTIRNNNIAPNQRAPAPDAKPPPERMPFKLPVRHKDNKRATAYLQSRGIDRGLIMDCINHGLMYESTPFHNAVFLGRDENGKTRYAALRGTTSNFKCDVDGSDKRYSFLLPPGNPNSRKAAIFEAPVDCLSHQTMCKQGLAPPFDGWRLSLGGTSLVALEHFIKRHPEVKDYMICTDNDEGGELAALRISGLPGITAGRSPPPIGNDYNEALQAMQKAGRLQNRARQSGGPSL